MSALLAFFAKLAAGHARRHKLEAILCLLGVALGVAVVVAIDAAVDAAVASFGGAVNSFAERSTHSIFADAGTLPDSAYLTMMRKDLPFPLSPIIDRSVLARTNNGVSNNEASASSSVSLTSPREAADGTLARLIGIDVFAERSLRSFTKMQSSLDADAFRQFLTEPNAIVLVDALARRLGVRVGDVIRLTVNERRVDCPVVGIVSPTGVARSQLTNLIVADLATAQELTGLIGRLDRIDTALASPAEVQQLTAALPPGTVLRSTEQRSESLAQLIGSYRLNLAALSLMASFVAVFIVYNSMLISVRQRATTLGVLRCLGAGRAQLAGLYLAEAAGFAIFGGILGVLGGWVLARELVGYVSTTINDLYAAVRPEPVTLTAMMWAKGLGVAFVSCLLGATVPLIAAARTPPVGSFRPTDSGRRSARAAVRLLAVASLLLGISLGVYYLPGDSPIAGFVMALLVASGFALACPWVTRLACMGLNAAGRASQRLPLQMAAAGVARSLGITGVAVAATMLALSMNVGVRTMVGSFRTSLGDWLGRRFNADIFVAPELLVNHKTDATLDPRVWQWIKSQPQTQLAVANRSIDVPVDGKPALLFATDVTHTLLTLPLKSYPHKATPFDPKKDVLVSEPLAGRAHLLAGGALSLETPTGRHTFDIRGVFYDFGTERGQLILDRNTYASDWKDDAISSLHVTLKAGVDRSAVADRWNAELRSQYPVIVDSYDGVKTEAMTVFDRTFKVTEVLTWLSGGVAFCGLAGSLLALALARRRDYAILAAVGMSGRQTAGWVLGQGLLLAWVSAAVAPVAGTALAYVLAYVIQYRSFGWSIPTSPHPMLWVQTLALSTAAALVAAVYPIYRLRSSPPAGDLRRD